MDDYRKHYDAYITSPKWTKRRMQYFAKHPKICLSCGSTVNIELHHRSYENFTKELDSDLRSLCQKCHARVHQLQKEYTLTLIEATDLVLNLKKVKKTPRVHHPIGKKSGVQFARAPSNTEERQRLKDLARLKKKEAKAKGKKIGLLDAAARPKLPWM